MTGSKRTVASVPSNPRRATSSHRRGPVAPEDRRLAGPCHHRWWASDRLAVIRLPGFYVMQCGARICPELSRFRSLRDRSAAHMGIREDVE